jgi:quinol monooxygenase YgiN
MAYAVSVTFDIDPAAWADFLPLMHHNATTSLGHEDGCLRFDVCTDPDHPNHVHLYEVYADRAAFDAHLASPHFAAFKTATEKMITARTIRTFRSVYP